MQVNINAINNYEYNQHFQNYQTQPQYPSLATPHEAYPQQEATF